MADFNSYLSSALKNSMVTGIPQISAANSLLKKVVRTLVFVVSVAGFIYQSLVFMNMYWEYETVIDIQVESSTIIDMPSLTVCNSNGFVMSKLCADPQLMDQCKTYTDDELKKLCKCLPHLCRAETSNKTIATPELVYKLAFEPFEKKKKYLQTIQELITHCDLTLTNTEDKVTEMCNLTGYRSIRCPTVRVQVENTCFTLFTVMGRPEEKPMQVLANGFSNMRFNPMPSEYPTTIKKASVQVSFHNPRTIISPYSGGLALEAGSKSVIRLKKIVKHLLPPPYETNCFDYIGMWKARGGWGPTSKKECIEECKKNATLKNRGCIEPIYKVPGNEPRCRNTSENVRQNVYDCSTEKCRPACYEESYIFIHDVTNKAPVRKADGSAAEDCTVTQSERDQIQMELRLEGMETTTYTYSPKYQNIETFSYLGGYVGMWLGISLLAVFDFLETLVIMMRYPLQRCQKRKSEQQKMNKIRKIQSDMW